MKTLAVQIAEAIVEKPMPDNKVVPSTWRLQVPKFSDRIVLFAAYGSENFADEWQIDVDLPNGYSYEDYESAIGEVFPNSETESDEYNRSIRIMSRKKLEDDLARILAASEKRLRAHFMRNGKKWYSVEGTGWLNTDHFQISPQEDDVDGGRAYFYAKTLDNRRYPLIKNAKDGAVADKGSSPFEFEEAYILIDLENEDHREEIEVFKTVGAYGIRFTDDSAPYPNASAW